VCIHTHTHTHTHTYIYIYIYIHTHARTRAPICTRNTSQYINEIELLLQKEKAILGFKLTKIRYNIYPSHKKSLFMAVFWSFNQMLGIQVDSENCGFRQYQWIWIGPNATCTSLCKAILLCRDTHFASMIWLCSSSSSSRALTTLRYINASLWRIYNSNDLENFEMTWNVFTGCYCSPPLNTFDWQLQ